MHDFGQIFKRHENDMIKFATRLSSCEHKAKDLVQEAAFKAYRHSDQLEDESKFKSWFSTIVYNVFITHYKKQVRRREIMAMAVDEHHFFNKKSSRNHGLEKLKVNDIYSLTKKVGPSSFAAFKKYIEGYSYKEISQLLGIAIGTVKSRIHFARTSLKKLSIKQKIVSC
jgi:RNA polymerase sigma-70 factor (ECF subfamily)